MPARIPGRALRAHAGRLGRDAPDAAAARLRRDRHREHVRRHPHRRGLDAGRLARACCPRPRSALGRAAACTSRSTARRPTSPAAASPIPMRTILSAAHAAALLARARARGAAARGGRVAGHRRRAPCPPICAAAGRPRRHDACRRTMRFWLRCQRRALRQRGPRARRARAPRGPPRRSSSSSIPTDTRSRPGPMPGAQPRCLVHARVRHAGRVRDQALDAARATRRA